jgi:hypothetical protein
MIKNNIKLAITFVAFIAIIISGGGVNADPGPALNFDSDTLVTINSYNYTISSGSKATTMEIGPTTLTVTVPALQTFTLVSSAGYSFGSAVTQSCSGNTNTLTVAAGTTVTITPNSSLVACLVSGGGSGGGIYTSTVTDTTPPTNTSIVIAAGATTASTTAVTLTLGATDAAQMMISNDASFTGGAWETYATSKAWTLTAGNGTKTVYAKFRDSALNASTTVSDTIVFGTETTTTTTTTTPTTTPTVSGLNLPYANATTPQEIAANRTALINYIITLIQARQTTTTTTAVIGIPSGFQFTTLLKQGMVSNDVKYLQIFLNSDQATSMGNSGRETTYFGGMTKDAVGKFQVKYSLATVSNAGYGQVGPMTRAKINSLLGM